MKYVYLIILPLAITIPTILMYLTNKSYNKEIIAKCSNIYGIELDTIRIQYENIKKEFDFTCFPFIMENIENMISLESSGYIDLKKLKMKRYRVFTLYPLYKNFKLMDEIDSCRDERILDLLNKVGEINRKIAKVRFPYKVKLNKLFLNMQMFLLFIAVSVMKKYKDITKDDVVQVENNDGFKDGTMSSGLTYQ